MCKGRFFSGWCHGSTSTPPCINSRRRGQKILRYFPHGGSIIYKAAAEELSSGEADKPGYEKGLIRKGKYSSVTINDYMKNIPAIGKAFNELLQHPELDQQGYCVEWYLNDKDVKCMVRLSA